MSKGKKRKRTHKTSTGKHKRSLARRQIMRCLMKINRWNKYKQEILDKKRTGSIERWDISGLEKHIKILEKLA